MRKAHIAERILSLFTSRDRAASMAGDLIENARGRSPMRFWADVCRTALSLLWRDFSADPSFLAGLAFRGLLVNLSLFIVMLIGIIVCSGLFGLIVRSPPLWVFRLWGAIAMCAAQFQTGQWLGRRARGKEMLACVAFLIVKRSSC